MLRSLPLALGRELEAPVEVRVCEEGLPPLPPAWQAVLGAYKGLLSPPGASPRCAG